MALGFYEAVLRLPFFVLLEWLLCSDLKQFSDWITAIRVLQITGGYLSPFGCFS